MIVVILMNIVRQAFICYSEQNGAVRNKKCFILTY